MGKPAAARGQIICMERLWRTDRAPGRWGACLAVRTPPAAVSALVSSQRTISYFFALRGLEESNLTGEYLRAVVVRPDRAERAGDRAESEHLEVEASVTPLTCLSSDRPGDTSPHCTRRPVG